MNAKYFRFRGQMKTCNDLEEIAAAMGSDVKAKIIYRRLKEAGLTCINNDQED